MASTYNLISIDKFAPHLIRKSAVVETGLATYHQVPNVMPSNSYLIPVAKPSLRYHTGSNQQSAFGKNSDMLFEELLVGVDRLEMNLEMSKDAVRDAIYSNLLSELDGRRPEDLSEHEFKTEVLTYFGSLVKRQMLSDLDRFLLYGADVYGPHLAKITSDINNFKMSGIVGGAAPNIVSDTVTLSFGNGGVNGLINIVDNYGNNIYSIILNMVVPLATADLSFLKGRRTVTITDIDNIGLYPFDAQIVGSYKINGSNQEFSIKMYVPSSLASLSSFTIAKNDDFEKKLNAAAEFAAELESMGAGEVKLAMNNSEFLKYNKLVHSGVSMPVNTVDSYQGFKITVVPALYDGIFVAAKEACHVVSGAAASDVQGEDLQIFDLSIIGEKKYRARLSVMLGGKAQSEYAAMFI